MMEEPTIRYGETIASTRLLGPGERAVLWVYGCCFDCPGCIAERFRRGPYREASARELADWALDTGAEGLTISGGEPMLQAAGLARMLELVRARRDMGVVVYSGFVYEELRLRAAREAALTRFLRQIDLLIDGPYIASLDHNEPYRGSSNQRVLDLTGRYAGELDAYYHEARGRKIELRLLGDKTLMVGVPGREQAAVWNGIKRLTESGGA